MILFYLVLFIGFFLIALVIHYFRKVLHSLAEHSVGLVNDLIFAGEDDEKIELIQNSTSRLLRSLAKTLGVFILSLIAGALPFIVYYFFTGKSPSASDFSSLVSILVLSAGATLPFLLPGGSKRKSDYSELSQLFHRMALNNYSLAWKFFTMERKRLKKRGMKTRKDFVIITGLARAGTTSLMNTLAEAEGFVSLNYGNMPFLLCPNTWRRFYRPKTGKLKERSHKDGIMIGLNSNEALEEYFFKVKADDSYIAERGMYEYSLAVEDYHDYLDYQAMIKKDPSKIYLAKNNNFLLRYHSLRSLNDEFLTVILYRDPLTHAASLMEKHRDYKRLQQEDPFVLEYMDWLGHHEFGLNQKSFIFGNNTRVPVEDRDNPDFWLSSWINYYEHALHIKHPNTLFVDYDEYCREPGKVLDRILTKVGIKNERPQPQPFHNRRKSTHSFSTSLLEKARTIWRELGLREY